MPDFIVFEDIVPEIKAQKMLTKDDEAQIINSLKLSRHEIGRLVNCIGCWISSSGFHYTMAIKSNRYIIGVIGEICGLFF